MGRIKLNHQQQTEHLTTVNYFFSAESKVSIRSDKDLLFPDHEICKSKVKGRLLTAEAIKGEKI